MAVVAVDPRLGDLVDLDVQVEKIAGGYTYTEGPLWDQRDQSLYFVDLQFAQEGAGIMYRWTEAGGAQVFRSPSQNSNGNTFDRQGRLITCVGDAHRVVRTREDGSIETIAEAHAGRSLNNPNDVICAPNGDIIFTDPYMALRGEPYPDPPPIPAVYRIRESDGSVRQLTTEIGGPNGLVMTDDGSRLLVDYTRAAEVHSFDVEADGSLSNHRIFAELKADGLSSEFTQYLKAQLAPDSPMGRLPDGMKLDSLGNLYVTSNCNEGIWVFDPEGALLGWIGVGEEHNPYMQGLGGPANLAWGGPDWKTLYVTAVTSVYRLPMKVAGQPVYSP